MLSERINRIQPSPTLAISAKAKAMRAAGEDVLSFRRGRTRFRHARTHQRGLHQSAARRRHQVHGGSRHAETVRCHREKMQRENKLTYGPMKSWCHAAASTACSTFFKAYSIPAMRSLFPRRIGSPIPIRFCWPMACRLLLPPSKIKVSKFRRSNWTIASKRIRASKPSFLTRQQSDRRGLFARPFERTVRSSGKLSRCAGDFR